MSRLIIQAQSSHELPVVATYTDPQTKERKGGIAITFARNRFNCFDSAESIYAADAEAQKRIRDYCEKRNAQFDGTYKFLTEQEYAQFGNTLELVNIWNKIRKAASTNPDTLSDVLSTVEIEILKRQSAGSVDGYEKPDMSAPIEGLAGAEISDAEVVSQTRPAANRGAATMKSQTPRRG